MEARDPQTPEEWQTAVNCADFHLCLDAAVKYGICETDVEADLDRCEEIIRRGALLGYHPSWSTRDFIR